MKTWFFRLTCSIVLLFHWSGLAATHYVDLNSTNPTPPYVSWSTAATNIQDSILTSFPGDMILVTNGVYNIGGKAIFGTMTNRVAIDKPVTVRSVNGPDVTIIEGHAAFDTSAMRCVYLASGASISGFTLTKGATQGEFDPIETSAGAAVWCASITATVSNCVIIQNSGFAAAAWYGNLIDCLVVSNSMYTAGGAYGCVLSNCTLQGNSATMYGAGAMESVLKRCVLRENDCGFAGGGAAGGALDNCILIGNRAQLGSGMYGGFATNCTLTGNLIDGAGDGGAVYAGTNDNCILYFNTNSSGAADNFLSANLNYCCTTPLPTNGIGNFTNGPLFMDALNGDLHLQSNSLCINAGNNAYASQIIDFDGNPRIAGGTVDVGAYEFQSPSSVLSYAWAQQHGFPTDGSADYTDADGDGANNWQEWRASTDPNNSFSLLKISSIAPSGLGPVITWQSTNTVVYYVQRSQNLLTASFSTVQSNTVGSVTGTSSYTDTNAVGGGPYFYRVGVQ